MKVFIIIILTLLGGVLYSIFGNERYKNKIHKLHLSRKKFSKDDFIHHFESKGYDPNNISIIYDEILEYLDVKEFSLIPDDNLVKLCDFHDLDDVEFIDHICSKVGVGNPSETDINLLNNKYQIFSFEYLLELIQRTSKPKRI